jgi:hypothetical protein
VLTLFKMLGERTRSRKLFENGEPLQHGVGHALATPASERKCVHEYGADLLVQFIAHEPPSAMQPRLYCIRLKTEDVRGVLGAHALDHPRHEYNPKYLGEIVGRSLDKLQYFPLRHCSFRIVGCRRLREFDDLSLDSFRSESFQVHSRAFTPQPPQGFIHGDAGKPCRKTGIAAKAAEIGKGFDIRFLDHIFGFGFIPQNAAGDPVQAAIVPLHDDAKRHVVTGERTPNEFDIVGRAGNMRRGCPVVLSIEAKLRRTGKGKRLLIENGSKAEFNADLATMITEAFAIRNQLLSGSDTSIEAMTERLGITKGRLASLVRLSYLAPDIVRALLDGRQPIELTPTRLFRLSKDLPHEWSEQRHFLGFAEGRSMSSGRNAL